MKRRGFTLIELLVIVAIVGILAAILFPVNNVCGENAGRSSCQSNLKQIALAVMQYRQDQSASGFPTVRGAAVYSSTFPYNPPYGWADALMPYLKSTEIFQCPSEEGQANNERDAVLPQFTDYWFNRRLAGHTEKQLSFPVQTIVFGEGNAENEWTDARYSLCELPIAWKDDFSSPANRHLEGANYCFVDGHVKWLKPGKITSTPASSGQYTFSIR